MLRCSMFLTHYSSEAQRRVRIHCSVEMMTIILISKLKNMRLVVCTQIVDKSSSFKEGVGQLEQGVRESLLGSC